MKKILILTIILISIFSCNGSNKQLKKDYKLLKSAKISIPNNLKITVKGQDSIIKDFFNTEIKLIVNVDSMSCNSCYVKSLEIWNPIIKHASIINNKIRFYFIFRPKRDEVNSIRIALLEANFDYPVIIDEEGAFRKANPVLSTNKLLNTFLLDKHNSVILVGDPTKSSEIKECFLTLIKNTSN